MPSGIIMQSSSIGATQEALEKVFADNGHEPDKPAVEAVEAVEPKREDFQSDDEFEEAKAEHDEKQQIAAEEAAEKEEVEAEKLAAKNKPLTRKQKAIDRATRELKDENRKLAERLAALEGKKGAEPETKIEVPKREKFKTDAEFDEAMFDYRYQVRRAKEAADQAQTTMQARLKQNYETYEASVTAFKDEHDDWEETVNSKAIPINESTYLSVIELGKDGPAVTYYLGKHPDYARQLADMTPHSAAMEVGRLATRLKTGARTTRPGAADSGVKPKPKPRLPEPVRPASTAATSSTMTSAEAAKKRDFRAFKTAQRAGR